jgi:hypothetical protein
MYQIKQLVNLYNNNKNKNTPSSQPTILSTSSTTSSNSILEIEFRLGELNENKFNPGITKLDYEAAIHTLDTLRLKNPETIIKTQESVFEDYFDGSYRQRTYSKPTNVLFPTTNQECVTKKKIAHCDFRVLQRKYDCRLGLKEEIKVESKSHSFVNSSSFNNKRIQSRKSYLTNDGCQIDVSQVETILPNNNNNNNKSIVTYEIEIEWRNDCIVQKEQNNINNNSDVTMKDINTVSVVTNTDDDLEQKNNKIISTICRAMCRWLLFVQECFTSPKICDAAESFIHFLNVDNNDGNNKSNNNNNNNNNNTVTGTVTDVLLVSTTRTICRAK